MESRKMAHLVTDEDRAKIFREALKVRAKKNRAGGKCTHGK